MNITVQASQGDINQYQKLLLADWTKKTLDEVLNLLHSVVVHSDRKWDRIASEGMVPLTGNDLNVKVIEHIRHASMYFEIPFVPKMADVFSNRKSVQIARAERTWTYLTLPTMTRMKGNTGFFVDVQSLLLLVAVDFLLPALKEKRFTAEHDCLLNAMVVYLLFFWSSNATADRQSHYWYLLSVIMEYLGRRNERMLFLRRSLDLTPCEDHSFMTKATLYWSDLVDLGQNDNALEFLEDLRKKVSIECLDEVAEMVRETVSRNGV